MFAALSADAQNKSVYTDLTDTKCKTLEFNENEGGSYKGECKGTGGFKLIVREGDLRQSIDIVTPQGKEFPLRIWEFFGGFSAVGEKAEWRVKNNKPIAIIFRLNVNEDPENIEKRTSYLIVAKITKDLACVTNIVEPGKDQNLQARQMADRSANTACRIAQ